MVAYVAKLLGIAPENVYCMGDNQNDIPMLAVSAIPFAPANCAQPVKDWGARLVGHTDDAAVAQVIEMWTVSSNNKESPGCHVAAGADF